MTHDRTITFGEVRALVQQPESPRRDLALCELLRDAPRAWSVEQGIWNYVTQALLVDPAERLRWEGRPGRLLFALRRGELMGQARTLRVDLRGCKQPQDVLIDELLAQNAAEPVAHLDLDLSMCGADWLGRLLRLGDWSGLRWLNARHCNLGGSLVFVIDALPEGLRGLRLGGNQLSDEDLSCIFERGHLADLRWLDLSDNLFDEAIEGWIECVDALDVRLLGLDMSGTALQDDELVELVDAGVLSDAMAFGCRDTHVSEYGLPALLWGMPAGQIEMLSFGQSGERREEFVDADAMAQLFSVLESACPHIWCFDWEYSDVVVVSSLIQQKMLDERLLLEQLMACDFWPKLDVLGLHGFCLNKLYVSNVLGPLERLDVLALSDLWCGYELPDSTIQFSSRHLVPFGKAITALELAELELGFMRHDDYDTRRQWDGWNETHLQYVLRVMLPEVRCHGVEQMTWRGGRGVLVWIDAMASRRDFRPRHLRLLFDRPEHYHISVDGLAQLSWAPTCHSFQTNHQAWSEGQIGKLRRLFTHPSMSHVLARSTPRNL